MVQRIDNTLQSHMYYTLKHTLNFDTLNVCAFLWCLCNNEDLWSRSLLDPHYLKIVQSYSWNNLSSKRKKFGEKKQNKMHLCRCHGGLSWYLLLPSLIPRFTQGERGTLSMTFVTTPQGGKAPRLRSQTHLLHEGSVTWKIMTSSPFLSVVG